MTTALLSYAGQQLQDKVSSAADALPSSGKQLQDRLSSVTDALPSSAQQDVQQQAGKAAQQLTDALPSPDQVHLRVLIDQLRP